MQKWRVQLAVIGAGPAGQKAAIQGAKLGKDVVIIDASERLGGACLHHGTIPSKTLRESILALTGFRDRTYGEVRVKGFDELSIHDLTDRLDCVLDKLTSVIERQFARNSIEVLRGRARFRNVGELDVTDASGEVVHRVRADRIIIATGSRPRHVENVPFDDDCILDSDRLLRLDRLPKSMLVLGGGVIGSEYATMLATLGVDVTLIDKVERPLRMLDLELGDVFKRAASELGVTLRFGTRIERIERAGDRARVVLDGDEILEAECALIALGRTANVEGLDLDRIGLELDSRGLLPVNPLFQTAWPNLYACGDVIGGPLASTAMEQGRLAVLAAFAERSTPFPENYPLGIYTIPEISWIGPTEEQLIARGVRYSVGRAHYRELARATIAGEEEGFVKMLFHTDTGEVLGVHALGTGATELIHVAQAAMHFGAKVDYFVSAVFNYPTFAEALRVAALDGINHGLATTAAEMIHA
ncbi:MAG: Si-specific NAD(P)(+) transhydrogenase [Planctomycetes bacterium]|nr:Si-specific NAD(P)(+) transhydrogenase [Planctomycetota bacterium]MCB9919003.1 Si-specific NAD(P)(+) transhydrogenase [Planctomycetota bacterium]